MISHMLWICLTVSLCALIAYAWRGWFTLLIVAGLMSPLALLFDSDVLALGYLLLFQIIPWLYIFIRREKHFEVGSFFLIVATLLYFYVNEKEPFLALNQAAFITLGVVQRIYGILLSRKPNLSKWKKLTGWISGLSVAFCVFRLMDKQFEGHLLTIINFYEVTFAIFFTVLLIKSYKIPRLLSFGFILPLARSFWQGNFSYSGELNLETLVLLTGFGTTAFAGWILSRDRGVDRFSGPLLVASGIYFVTLASHGTQHFLGVSGLSLWIIVSVYSIITAGFLYFLSRRLTSAIQRD